MAEAVLPQADRRPISLLLVVFTIVLWYIINISVVIFNKAVLSSFKFNFPIFMTFTHMAACTLLGFLIQSVFGCMPVRPLASSQHLLKVAILSVVFCASIVLGNASLEYIPVSFNQAIGSTTPFFTAILALVIQGAHESRLTYCTLIPIVMGIIIASGGEPTFHVLGFVLCFVATAARALKTVVQAMLLTDPAEKLDPMSLLLYMSAIASAVLLPIASALEPEAFTQCYLRSRGNPMFVWMLTLNAALAYALNLVNFFVTKFTSALTLQVLGQGKGVLAAFLSVLIFHNKMTLQGIVGYAITVSGVLGYSYTKQKSSAADKAAAAGKAAGGGGKAAAPLTDSLPETEPLLTGSDRGDGSRPASGTTSPTNGVKLGPIAV